MELSKKENSLDWTDYLWLLILTPTIAFDVANVAGFNILGLEETSTLNFAKAGSIAIALILKIWCFRKYKNPKDYSVILMSATMFFFKLVVAIILLTRGQ